MATNKTEEKLTREESESEREPKYICINVQQLHTRESSGITSKTFKSVINIKELWIRRWCFFWFVFVVVIADDDVRACMHKRAELNIELEIETNKRRESRLLVRARE